MSQGALAAGEGRLVRGKGGPKGKGRKAGAPQGARQCPPPRLGGHMKAPHRKDGGPPGGGSLTDATVGPKNHSKVGYAVRALIKRLGQVRAESKRGAPPRGPL